MSDYLKLSEKWNRILTDSTANWQANNHTERLAQTALVMGGIADLLVHPDCPHDHVQLLAICLKSLSEFLEMETQHVRDRGYDS